LGVVPDPDQSGYPSDPFLGSGSEFRKTSVWIRDEYISVAAGVQLASLCPHLGHSLTTAVFAYVWDGIEFNVLTRRITL